MCSCLYCTHNVEKSDLSTVNRKVKDYVEAQGKEICSKCTRLFTNHINKERVKRTKRYKETLLLHSVELPVLQILQEEQYEGEEKHYVSYGEDILIADYETVKAMPFCIPPMHNGLLSDEEEYALLSEGKRGISDKEYEKYLLVDNPFRYYSSTRLGDIIFKIVLEEAYDMMDKCMTLSYIGEVIAFGSIKQRLESISDSEINIKKVVETIEDRIIAIRNSNSEELIPEEYKALSSAYDILRAYQKI